MLFDELLKLQLEQEVLSFHELRELLPIIKVVIFWKMQLVWLKMLQVQQCKREHKLFLEQ
jgi:hypothetical protein